MPTVEISDEAFRKVKRLASAQGIGISEYVDALLLEENGSETLRPTDANSGETRAPKPFIPVRGREGLAQQCQDWLKTRER